MSTTVDTVITVGGAVFGSLTIFAAARLRTKIAGAIENRKVTLSEFDLFKESYIQDMTEFRSRYAEQEAKMTKVERLLRLALTHILDLRADMRAQSVNPSHATPRELVSLLWTITEDESDIDAPVPSAPQGE
jgi:hypothetical protein